MIMVWSLSLLASAFSLLMWKWGPRETKGFAQDEQRLCGRSWTPQLSLRPLCLHHAMLSYLDPALGCPMLVFRVSLHMDLEECVSYTETMKLLFI